MALHVAERVLSLDSLWFCRLEWNRMTLESRHYGSGLLGFESVALGNYLTSLYRNFLIHSSADWHLGCFRVLAVVNSAAKNNQLPFNALS